MVYKLCVCFFDTIQMQVPKAKEKVDKGEESEEDSDEEEEGQKRKKKQQLDSPFLGMISRCFEAHLNIYVTSQDKSVLYLNMISPKLYYDTNTFITTPPNLNMIPHNIT